MSWRRFCGTSFLKTFWKSLEDVMKKSWKHLETSWRRLEDVLKTFFSRGLENFLKTSRRRMIKTNILVLIKTSSEDVWVRRIYSSWSRRLEDLWRQRGKTSSTPLQGIFIKTNVCWEIRQVVFITMISTLNSIQNFQTIKDRVTQPF